MSYIGQKPADKLVTSSDMEDGIVTSAKIVDETIATADVADDAITLAKMASGTDGNIISYDASGNPVAIATGTDGQVLTSTGAGSPPAFEALPGGGKILQVLGATDKTERSTTSTSFVTASNTLSVAITPSSISSRILIIATGTTYQTGGQSAHTIYRGGTNLATASKPDLNHHENARSSIAMTFLDSPASTSELTYQVYFKNTSGSTTNLNPNASESSIQVMEIGA
jgi:hypothetical protein